MRLKRSLTLLAGAVGTVLTAGTLMAGPALAATASHPAGAHPAHSTSTRAAGAHSAGAPRAITPRDGVTVTTLILSSSSVNFGQESSLKINASVSASQPGGLPPRGTVTIKSGQTVICTITVLFVGGTCSPSDSQLTPGQYTLTAFYSGDGLNIPSTSTPVLLTVLPQGTSLSLGVTVGSVPLGAESNAEIDVDVVPNAGTVTPTGGYVVEANGTVVCTGNLPAGSGIAVCHMDNAILPPGSYQLTANYTGDANYAPGSAPPTGFTVTNDPTTTDLLLPAFSLGVSQEGGAQLGFVLNPAAATPGLVPTGTVTFSAGSTVLCTSQVSGTSGTCALATAQLPLGSYQVTAAYSGDGNFGGSTSPSLTLTITKDKANASLTLSAAKATFGSEQSERFTVNVTGHASATPTGKVTIKSGTTTVCSFTLASGHGSCAPTATQLRPGTYHITATYGGDTVYGGFTTRATTLAVAKEPTTSTLTLSSATVKSGSETSEHLSVQVKPKFSGTPTGKVTIKAGSTTVCTITLKGAKGTCTLTASQLAPGTYHLTASYSGTASFAVSTSTAKTLTVTK